MHASQTLQSGCYSLVQNLKSAHSVREIKESGNVTSIRGLLAKKAVILVVVSFWVRGFVLAFALQALLFLWRALFIGLFASIKVPQRSSSSN